MSSFISNRHDIPIINNDQFDSLVQHTTLPLRHHNNPQYLQAPPLEADLRPSPSPISTIESSPATSTLDFDSGNNSDYYMQRVSAPQYQRPASLETIGLPQSFHPRSAVGPQRSRPLAGVFHKRTNSDSTIQSSPYTPTSFPLHPFQPYIVDSEVQQYSPHHEFLEHTPVIPKSYPQISQPIDHSAYYAPDYSPAWHNNVQQYQYEALRQQAFYQQQAQFQGLYRNMAETEQANGMQEKMAPAVLGAIRGIGPRTISAICEDELYNPAEPARISKTVPMLKTDANTASPTNRVFQEALQTAQQSHLDAARSGSPQVSTPGNRSPYAPNPALYDAPNSPARMETAASMRKRHEAEAAERAILVATRRQSRESSQTVSPKEVSLEYEAPDSDNSGMFAKLSSPPRQKNRPSRLNQELTRSSTNENMFVSESSNLSNDSAVSTGNQNTQILQQYPFISRQRSSGFPESSQESNPRFPATLISMESTRSERSDPRSRSSAGNSPEAQKDDSEGDVESEETDAQRPDNTRSDGGTYSCTYHGCTLRFETPQKLQRHKKEGHRQGTPSTNPQTKMTQAGLHKCTRTNPQTGKPCNSEFSRPYDLTRHEDTIHNAKKQKVRCPVCVEEKTFSRNDALTRHMRVVHSDVPFDAGKSKGSR